MQPIAVMYFATFGKCFMISEMGVPVSLHYKINGKKLLSFPENLLLGKSTACVKNMSSAPYCLNKNITI